MKSFAGVVLYLALCIGAVLCDEKCDDAMKNVTAKYGYSVGSTDVSICYELIQANCGEQYASSLVEKRPTVYFDVGNKCQFLTLVFFGQCNEGSMQLLWMTYNIRAEDLKNGFTGQSGNNLVIYTQPKTSEGVSDHFVYISCQDGLMNTFDCCSSKEKENFDLNAFNKPNKLKDIVGSVFFQVTADGQLMDKSKVTEGRKCTRQ